MYTKFCRDLHERSLIILEMIVRAKRRKTDAEAHLKLYQVSDDFSLIKLCGSEAKFKQEIQRWEDVRMRLVSWYADVQIRLNKEVMNRMHKENENINAVTVAERYHAAVA